MGLGQQRDHPYGPRISLFQQEMQIRLWWYLRTVDARSAKLKVGGFMYHASANPATGFKQGAVDLPLNVNDCDLHADMTQAPAEHTGATEMIYCLMKYEAAEWLLNSPIATKAFPIPAKWSQSNGQCPVSGIQTTVSPFGPPSNLAASSLTGPGISSTPEPAPLPHIPSSLAPKSPQVTTLKIRAIAELERTFETKYLRHCDPLIPLHRLSAVMGRLSIARMRFTALHPRHTHHNHAECAKHGTRHSGDGAGRTYSPSEADQLFDTAVTLLELDVAGRGLPFAPQLLAHMVARLHLEAIVVVVSELRRRVAGKRVDMAWAVIGELFADGEELLEMVQRASDESMVGGNWSARNGQRAFYAALGDLVLEAWEARRTGLVVEVGKRAEDATPGFVRELEKTRKKPVSVELEMTEVEGNVPMQMPLGFDILGQGHVDGQFTTTGLGNMAGLGVGDLNALDWGCWNDFLQM